MALKVALSDAQPLSLLGIAALATLLVGSLGPARPQTATLLQPREPIVAVDARLRRLGWKPVQEPPPLDFERQLSGNGLISLRSCSGTGEGFCRYDYRRGRQELQVITIPNAAGDGVVLRWALRP